MTTKRSANRLTRSTTLGASVWAPTVGFATLGMATVAAITMVGLEQGADHVHAPTAADSPQSSLTVSQPQRGHVAAKTATPATPRTRTIAYTRHVTVADATAVSAKHRLAEVLVTAHKVPTVASKAVRKTNPAPAVAHKGAPAPQGKGGGDASGGSSGGAAHDAPTQPPAQQQALVDVTAPTGTGTSVDIGGLVHLGL